MDIKKFEEFEARINQSSCPKDFFGEIIIEKFPEIVKSIFLELENITKGESDANLDYRKSFVKTKLATFSKWGFEALSQGTYDQKLPYRVKLRFSVREHQGKKLFFVEDCSDIEVFFDELVAVHFEGYTRYDRVYVERDGSIISDGSVIYYGTHAACEYFRGLTNNGDFQYRLSPTDFNIGDCITVETLRYSSSDEFARMIVGFYGVGNVLENAFHKNNGVLTKDQLSEVAKEGRKQFEEKMQRRSFVLTSE